MNRPTISMAMIIKNEAHNLGPNLQSVRGCFDEIVIIDTGSTDSSMEFLDKINAKIEAGDPDWSGLPKIKVGFFNWVNDFAKARNFSFEQCTSDYVYWHDADDVLSDRDAFISWRDNVMHSAHYWLVKYNYAYDQNGRVECEFIRERVVKNNHGYKWKYFVHEGLVQTEDRKQWTNRVNTWTVNHQRTAEDMKQDHLRNIKLFESHDYEKLEPREKFYLGKEYVENGFPQKGSKPLMEALSSKELDLHDRLLATQYAAQAAFSMGALPQSTEILMNGLMVKPSRAEYWCLLGDIYLNQNQVTDALMAYKCALQCTPDDLGGITVIYKQAYGEYPNMKLADVYLALGDWRSASLYVENLKAVGHPKSVEYQKRLDTVKDLSIVRTGLPKTDDVIITCPPGGVVTDWDENTLEAKGHGGSETAAIEVARWIKKKTGRRVKIFQQRSAISTMPSGVEYLPVEELKGYLNNIEPYAHIAWRHPSRLTWAKSFIWCHDLQCPGASQAQNYDKIVALSEFHKNYLIETNGVPKDKIVLGYNGINPDDFNVEHEPRDPLKVVFSSSPDRGLVQSIDIVKKARELSNLDIKLHCFYGTENLRKMGHTDWANAIEQKIKDNDFVVYHGMVPKKTLMKHFFESAVWLYPADFIESYCITAIEALACGTWPIVRDMGALKYTMKEAIEKNMCDVLTAEVKDEASVLTWAKALVSAIEEKKYERVMIERSDYSWERVADLFIKEMSL